MLLIKKGLGCTDTEALDVMEARCGLGHIDDSTDALLQSAEVDDAMPDALAAEVHTWQQSKALQLDEAKRMNDSIRDFLSNFKQKEGETETDCVMEFRTPQTF